MPTTGTRRRLERPTYGGHAALVAERLGTPYLPAQQHIADVALEFDPVTGLFCYSTVVIILPRQSGKTTVMVLSFVVLRGVMWPNQFMVYTAQDRNHASDKFRDDFIVRMREAPGFEEGRDFSVRLANGSERITFDNGSYLYVSASGPQSGHSKTLDMPVVDEAWYHDNHDVDTGFRVPMITRKRLKPGAQQLITTAAGEENRSVYLAAKREAGERAVAADTGRGIAYFDYSCPRDLDPMDRRNWWLFMPGLGHTITEEDVAEELEAMGDRQEWLRAYCSWDKPAGVSAAGIDLELWASRGVDGDAAGEMTSEVVLGVAMPLDGSVASVLASGWLADGRRQVEHVDSRAGFGWLYERLVELWEKWPDIAGVAVDTSGPAAWLLAELEKAEIPTFRVSQANYANYCASFVQHLDEDGLQHVRHEVLDRAVMGSARRSVGERWLWDRRLPDVDVSALEAGTLAAGALAAYVDDEFSSAYDEHGFDEDW